MSNAKQCTCTHPRSAHEHLRPGSDCSLCEDGGCKRFQPARSKSAVLTTILTSRRLRGTRSEQPGLVLRMPTAGDARDKREDDNGDSVAHEA